jgi:hypothetical protein
MEAEQVRNFGRSCPNEHRRAVLLAVETAGTFVELGRKELAHLGRGLTSMCRLCAKTATGGWTRAKTTPFSTPTLILRSLCRQR